MAEHDAAHRARLTVCAYAADATEAEALLAMLGLHPAQQSRATPEFPDRFNTKRLVAVRTPHAVNGTLFKTRPLPDPKDG